MKRTSGQATALVLVAAAGVGLLAIGVGKVAHGAKKAGAAIARPFHHQPKPAPKPWARPANSR